MINILQLPKQQKTKILTKTYFIKNNFKQLKIIQPIILNSFIEKNTY
jgi:hypothetical protein